MYQITLEAARVNAKMTQKEVAARMEKSLSTIRNWETGRSIPDAIEFKRLCMLYQIPTDAIFLPKK